MICQRVVCYMPQPSSTAKEKSLNVASQKVDQHVIVVFTYLHKMKIIQILLQY